ncbi:hypothetical protein NQ317_018684 [Molorchus minor]|uniref:Uncharacterized protein n=1 Tax=Molorchus minor TaxID=1323400 RepID=A0ABQ9J4B9_9CUCU|nr:hypothetical protein NQ317_018684 [Molorchus minor]
MFCHWGTVTNQCFSLFFRSPSEYRPLSSFGISATAKGHRWEVDL